MRVSIVGSGYVGLVTGVCLAEQGHAVTCVDIDESRVDLIARGESPIYEPGLQDLLRSNVGQRLTATTDLAAAVAATELTLITVGTPFDGTRKDLTYVAEAARGIGRALRDLDRYHVVVVKSTVPPGTTDDLVRPILEAESGRTAGEDFGVGMNPEFLREGEAVADFMNPDRLVFGALDDRTAAALDELYAAFPRVDRVRVSNATAEMIKYASNSLFAMLISFSNEIGNLCAAVGDVDVVDVLRSVHLDRRVSPVLEDGARLRPGLTSYLEAGCGFGGSCFPKDVQALIAHGREAGVPMRLLDAVMQVNRTQPDEVVKLLSTHFPSLDGVAVTVLGLAFKPGTDDIRESPSIPVVRALLSRGARVTIHDPVAVEAGRRALGEDGLRFRGDLAEAVGGASAIVLLTRWPEYLGLADLVRDAEPPPLVVDGRRFLDPAGFARYEGIGYRRTGAAARVLEPWSGGSAR